MPGAFAGLMMCLRQGSRVLLGPWMSVYSVNLAQSFCVKLLVLNRVGRLQGVIVSSRQHPSHTAAGPCQIAPSRRNSPRASAAHRRDEKIIAPDGEQGAVERWNRPGT